MILERTVVTDILGNEKDPNYKIFVADSLDNFDEEVNFLRSHLDCFSENLKCRSDEEGEWFNRLNVDIIGRCLSSS